MLADPGSDIRRLVTDRAMAAARADAASLIMPTAEPTELTNVVAAGLGADVYSGVTFSARNSALGRAIVTGEAVLVQQLLPWASDHDDPPNPMRLGPAMTLPLPAPRGRNAALVLSRTTDREPFDEDEHELAAPFAELVALALRHTDERAGLRTSAGRTVRDNAVQVLHDDLAQRLFAVGVGLQSVIDLGVGEDATRRLRGHLDEVDAMMELLRRAGQDAPPVEATPERA